VGQELELAVEVLPAGLAGARSFEWTVDIEGAYQVLTPLADPEDRIVFTPQLAGPYQIVVNATVGSFQCTPALGVVTVTAAGAVSQDYRMRVTPLTGAPMEDSTVRVYGGGNSALPAKQLSSGDIANGKLTDSGGVGVPAYLRARKRGTLVDTDYEAFADANGSFSLNLPTGPSHYDLLAVPSGGLLPAIFLEDLAIADIGTVITMPAPIAISGELRTQANQPVEGAQVSLVVDGAPSTTATSGADGSFTVLSQAGKLTGLTVAPAADSGMPALRAEGLLGQDVNSASNVAIQYATPVVTAEVDLTLAGGAAAGFARVEWRAASPQFATVNVGQTENIAGVLRVLATSDASGHAQAPLAAVVADLAVQSADASEGIVIPALDWAASPTIASALEALVPVSVSVAFAESAAQGAQVLALPRASLAPQAAAMSATVPASGTAVLALLRGGDYELVVSDLNKGTMWSSVANVASDTLVPAIALPGNIQAAGYVYIDGSAARGARVSLFCQSCAGVEATRVRAQAVTDSTGRYVLRVADPGIAAP
jgi:hypothetical protein